MYGNPAGCGMYDPVTAGGLGRHAAVGRPGGEIMTAWERFTDWWVSPRTQGGFFTLWCVVGLAVFVFLLVVAVGYYVNIYVPIVTPTPPVDPGARYQLWI